MNEIATALQMGPKTRASAATRRASSRVFSPGPEAAGAAAAAFLPLLSSSSSPSLSFLPLFFFFGAKHADRSFCQPCPAGPEKRPP